MEKKYGPLATKARNALEEEFKKGKRSKEANTQANYLLPDGTWGNTKCEACYAACNYGRGWSTKAVAIIASVQSLKVDEKVARRYFEWLLHFSPYQEVFVTRSAKVALGHGVFVVDTDKPSNLLFGGLTAARMVSEYARIPNMWNDLVEHGVHPSFAFVFAHYLCKSSDKLTISGFGNGHTAIDGVDGANSYYARFTDKIPINFHKNIRIDRPSYHKTGKFDGINVTWTKENPLTKNIKIIGKLPDILADAAKERVKSANIFKKDKLVDSPEYNLGMEAVSEFFKKIVKEIPDA